MLLETFMYKKQKLLMKEEYHKSNHDKKEKSIKQM
jgi:hypothetical protein